MCRWRVGRDDADDRKQAVVMGEDEMMKNDRQLKYDDDDHVTAVSSGDKVSSNSPCISGRQQGDTGIAMTVNRSRILDARRKTIVSV